MNSLFIHMVNKFHISLTDDVRPLVLLPSFS